MKIRVQEFISADNPEDLIGGDEVTSQSQITSKSTTDQVVAATRQPVSLQNYRRYATESVLPFAEQADKYASEPQKFMDFLREQGAEDVFEAYFVEARPSEKKNGTTAIQELAKEKALKMAEQILNQRRSSTDVIKREMPLPTIDEIKTKDGLIVSKLERIAEYCANNLNESEQKVLLSHFNSLLSKKKVVEAMSIGGGGDLQWDVEDEASTDEGNELYITYMSNPRSKGEWAVIRVKDYVYWNSESPAAISQLPEIQPLVKKVASLRHRFTGNMLLKGVVEKNFKGEVVSYTIKWTGPGASEHYQEMMSDPEIQQAIQNNNMKLELL